MEYILLAFALLMGMTYAVLAYNKDGHVCVPIMGALAFAMFWFVFNEVSLVFYGQSQLAWTDISLWLEASITTLVAAFVGYNNTYAKEKKDKEKGAWRFWIPTVVMIITIFMF